MASATNGGDVRECAMPKCGETFTKLRCSKCKLTWEHQREHWAEHKPYCSEPLPLLGRQDPEVNLVRSKAQISEKALQEVLALGSVIKEADIAAPSDGQRPRAVLKSVMEYRHFKIQQEEAACIQAMNDVQRQLETLSTEGGDKSEANADNGANTHHDLEGQLRKVQDELRFVQRKKVECMADIQSSVRWEHYESGVETRDVLANGERKAFMEAVLGREVKNKEVEWEADLPAKERLQLMAERRATMERKMLTRH